MKELKGRGAVDRDVTRLRWNPVKELKEILIILLRHIVKTTWNPVKELKVVPP